MTSAMLSDGTIASADLANGAATTSKQTANAALSVDTTLGLLYTSLSIDVTAAYLTLPADETHLVTVDADVLLALDGDQSHVILTLQDNGVPLDNGAQSLLVSATSALPVHLSALVDASGGPHVYSVHVENQLQAVGRSTVIVEHSQTRVVDLGLQP